jgi:hypothetical protein
VNEIIECVDVTTRSLTYYLLYHDNVVLVPLTGMAGDSLSKVSPVMKGAQTTRYLGR